MIQEQYDYQVNLKKRKEEVLTRIETLGHLNDDIVKMVNACTRLSQVEDIYRPYKQKKKTRIQVIPKCFRIKKTRGILLNTRM